jgi:hypothetical protein
MDRWRRNDAAIRQFLRLSKMHVESVSDRRSEFTFRRPRSPVLPSAVVVLISSPHSSRIWTADSIVPGSNPGKVIRLRGRLHVRFRIRCSVRIRIRFRCRHPILQPISSPTRIDAYLLRTQICDRITFFFKFREHTILPPGQQLTMANRMANRTQQNRTS